MGLTISHGAYGGHYHQFDQLRRRIAEAIGAVWCTPTDDHWYWGDADPNRYCGLRVLFCHSDCDGSIGPKIARRIAQELMSIESLRDDKEVQQLRKGCNRAWRQREKLVFS